MKCKYCEHNFEKPTAICPWCGKYLLDDVLLKPSSKPNVNEVSKSKTLFELLNVVKRGDSIKAVQYLAMQPNLDLNKRFNFERTILMYAVWKEPDYETVKLLLKYGSDPNLQDAKGWSALMYAARYCNNPKIIDLLLEARADVNVKTIKGVNALILAAAYNSDVNVLSCLVKHGGNINYCDCGGWSPLMHAVFFNNNINMISRLLYYGADINLKNNDGWSPLMLAAKYANDDSKLDVLLSDSRVNRTVTTKNGLDIPMLVCSNKNCTVYKLKLVNKYYSLTSKDNYNRNCLMLAVENDLIPEIWDYLIDYGISIFDKNINNRSSIDYIINSKLSDKIWFQDKLSKELLNKYNLEMLQENCNRNLRKLKKGWSINYDNLIKDIKEPIGPTLQSQITRLFASKGVMVFDRSLTNAEKLVMTFVRRYTNIGIDCFLSENKQGKILNFDSVLDKILSSDSIFDCKRNNGQNIFIYIATEGITQTETFDSRIEILKTMLKYGADIDAVDNNKRTAAMILAKSSRADRIIEFLYEFKSNSDLTDINDMDAAMISVYYGARSDTLETIIVNTDLGGNVNCHGWSALKLAARFSSNFNYIGLLIDYGAGVDDREDEDSWTALMDAARYNSNEKVTEELLKHGANPELTNGDGWNAYKLAKKYNPNSKVAKLIRSYM